MEEAEILKDLNNEYSFIRASTIEPSYYRIKSDGTIIRCLTRLIAMTLSDNQKNNSTAISINEVSAFVKSDNKRPQLYDPKNTKPLSSEDIEDEDVEYDVLRENFSIYQMDNGQTIKIKTAVGQIVKFNRYTVTGEPIYTVTPTPIVRIKNKN